MTKSGPVANMFEIDIYGLTVQPLKWELKQKPGISPPRGGFKTDDPNQQIVAEDIFDEYGGKLVLFFVPFFEECIYNNALPYICRLPQWG